MKIKTTLWFFFLLQKTLAEETLPIGTLKTKQSSFHVENLVMINKKMFLFIQKNERIKTESLLKNEKNLVETGIGFMKTGIYFDSWTSKESSEEKTKNNKKIKRWKQIKRLSSAIPIYIIYTDNPKIDLFKKDYLVEKRTTIIFSTLWENIFRVFYSLNAAFYSVKQFNFELDSLLFLEYTNKEIQDYNMKQRGNPKNILIPQRFISFFGEYAHLHASNENKVYKNVFFGVSKDSLFLEVNEMKPVDYQKDEYRKRQEVLQLIKEKIRNKIGIETEQHSKGLFNVLIVKRKKRKIINNEDLIAQIEKIKNEKDCKINVVDFEDISLEEQFRLASECDLFVASHGAAMVHIFLMKKKGFILELFPYKFRKTIYMNISNHLEIKYFYWENTNIENAFDLQNKKFVPDKTLAWDKQEIKDYFRNQNTIINKEEIKKTLSVIFEFEKYKKKKYLLHTPWKGFNNQLIAFKTACIIAKGLGRVLVVPMFGDLKEKKQTEAFFSLKDVVWSNFGNYFDLSSLNDLECETIHFSHFTALEVNADLVLMDEVNQDINEKLKQMFFYYKDIVRFGKTKINVRTKALIEETKQKILSIYKLFDNKQVLALGILLNKIAFDEKEESPPKKLHDYRADKEYKKITNVLQYNKRMYSVAAKIIKIIKQETHSFDLAIHATRDKNKAMCLFLKNKNIRLYSSYYQETEYIIKAIKAVLGEDAQGKTIYIVSKSLEYKEIEHFSYIKNNNVFFLKELITKEDDLLDPIEKSIVEQIICSKAKNFIGNYFSSYTRAIVEQRNAKNFYW